MATDPSPGKPRPDGLYSVSRVLFVLWTWRAEYRLLQVGSGLSLTREGAWRAAKRALHRYRGPRLGRN